MRCPCYLPAVWHISFNRVSSGLLQRALFLVLLLGIIFFILIITISDTRLLWRQQKLVDDHPLAQKSVSVAVATDLSNPSLNYGVVIDCGSSGSRVFVYFWPPHEGQAHELLNIQSVRDVDAKPVVKKIEPGISAYADTPSGASDYIKPLLQFAESHIPKDKHKETPVYIMATAGMRMIKESEQEAILNDLRVDIPLDFNFVFAETHAEVISGKMEGVYAWISINYALGKFDHSIGDDPLVVVEVPGTDKKTHIRKRTVGTLDMGGGSLQIAYEVPKSDKIAKGMLTEFNLGCTKSDLDHTYRVYVTTFLGYGANAAMAQYEKDLIRNSIAVHNGTTVIRTGSSQKTAIAEPCLNLDYLTTLEDSGRTLYLRGTGDFAKCQENLKPYLNQSVPCAKEPCSMNGVFQPDIDHYRSEFFGFSEFYYSMEDILRMGGKYHYGKFKAAAKDYCSTSWDSIQTWIGEGLYPRADNRRYKQQCFKSAWMSLVLHEGLKFPQFYNSLKSVQYIEGREVHWTLGALLYKTRFYPLRDIEKATNHHEQYQPPWVMNQLQHSYSLLLICVLIVVAAILIYLRRLRIVPQASLRRVPTMSYFMTEEGQMEEGLMSTSSPGPYKYPLQTFQFTS